MTKATNLPLPPADFAGVTKYAIFPREKRAFHTVLDAHKILAGSNNPVSEIRYSRDGAEIVVALDHPIADGRLRERRGFGRHFACSLLGCGRLGRGLRRRRRSVRTPHLRCFAKQNPGEFSDGFHRFFVRRCGAA